MRLIDDINRVTLYFKRNIFVKSFTQEIKF